MRIAPWGATVKHCGLRRGRRAGVLVRPPRGAVGGRPSQPQPAPLPDGIPEGALVLADVEDGDGVRVVERGGRVLIDRPVARLSRVSADGGYLVHAGAPHDPVQPDRQPPGQPAADQ